MSRHLLLILALAVILPLGFGGCTTDPVFPERPITVAFTGLPPLGGGACYQLWISYPAAAAQGKGPNPNHGDAAFFSAGRFRVTSSGTMVDAADTAVGASFKIPTGYNPGLIIDAVLTVESVAFPSATPGSKLLSGSFTGTQTKATARLTLTGDDAFGTNLSDTSIRRTISGQYMLDAPTGSDTVNFARGIWFVKGAAANTAGLTLPLLPFSDVNPKWTYQGWLVHHLSGSNVEYISLGKFTDAGKPDDDGAGTAAGPNTGKAYAFPGSDFAATGSVRVLNDGNYGVVVSMQPLNVPLGIPLIPLLKRDPIPTALARLTPDQLGYAPTITYTVDVTVDR